MSLSIAGLFHPSAVIVEATPRLVDELLFPEERAHIARAVEKRRAQFGSARLAARQALAELGVAPGPLLPGPRGAPVWPPGVVGSITHTDGYCAAVVAKSPPLLGLGIDAERVRALENDVQRRLLTAREQQWLAGEPEPSRTALTLLVFSAKEAYYKCQFPLSSAFLEFKEVEVEVDARAGRFRASTSCSAVPPQVASLDGRFLFRDGLVISGIEAPDQDAPPDHS